MKEIEYAFLGGIYPDANLENIKRNSRCSLDYAANALQSLMIKGFDYNIQAEIKIFNRLFIGSFPHKFRVPVIRTVHFSHNGSTDDINMGFLNIFPFRQLLIHTVPVKHIVRWAKSEHAKRKVLIVYSTTFLETIIYLKRLCPNLYICLIIPDMPIYNELEHSGNLLYRCRNKYRQKLLENLINKIDSFVPITYEMRKVLDPCSVKPAAVIEGMIDCNNQYNSRNSNVDIPISTDKELVKVVYTGTLTKKYGILDLLSAFMNIKDRNYRLIICGGGEAEQELRAAEKLDSRICYRGILTHDESVNLQRQASILINPRPNCGDYTKYSFPSKLLEYLLVGKPVVSFKLAGIPSEYDEYLFYPPKDGSEGLLEAIVKLGSMTEKERDNIGKRNMHFVLSNKDCRSQTKIILDMIEKSII